MTTGERLYKLRKQSGLMLEKISEILEISYQAYRKYEKDFCYPSVENLIKLTKMYNTTADYILCLSDNDNRSH